MHGISEINFDSVPGIIKQVNSYNKSMCSDSDIIEQYTVVRDKTKISHKQTANIKLV